MKKIILGLTLLTSFASLAQTLTLTCHYDGNGYDQETIEATTKNGKVESIEFVSTPGNPSYEKFTGSKSISNSVFKNTQEGHLLSEYISFSEDLESATYFSSYRDGGELHVIRHFKCVKQQCVNIL